MPERVRLRVYGLKLGTIITLLALVVGCSACGNWGDSGSAQQELFALRDQITAWVDEVAGVNTPRDVRMARTECELNLRPHSGTVEVGVEVDDPIAAMVALGALLEAEYDAEPISLAVNLDDRRFYSVDGTTFRIDTWRSYSVEGNLRITVAAGCYGQ